MPGHAYAVLDVKEVRERICGRESAGGGVMLSRTESVHPVPVEFITIYDVTLPAVGSL